MGFFNEIKKLLWVQKSVAKSGANKAADAGKELGEDMLEKGSELLKKTKDTAADMSGNLMDKAGDVGGEFMGKAGDAFSTAKDFASDITEKAWDKASPYVDKAADTVEGIGGTVMDKASPLVEKTKDLAENVGGKVLETGGELIDKTASLSENIGSKILEKGGELMDKAQEMGGELKGKADDLVDHANKVATGEETMESLSETTRKIGEKLNKETELSGKLGYDEHKGSMLEGHDDFFSKAEKWADGNHGAFNDPSLETTTPKIDSTTPPPLELPKEPFEGDIKGFTDNDGDGDPLIDDAEIEEDDK